MSRKTILFVTYGGGHAGMLAPAVRELSADKDLHIEVLALTTGAAVFKKAGIPYKGYKDFVTPGDEPAIELGKKLAASYHVPETGIEEDESIAYLGLSYWDLLERHGEKEAARLWAEKGRQAFLQLGVLARIMDSVQPDLVVTTNSPRSEQAATEIAIARDIPTLAVNDHFAGHHFYTLKSRYFAVMAEQTITNLLNTGVDRPRSAFHITGNPAFDHAFDYRGPIDYAWRKQHFPTIPDKAKILLWADMPAYWNMETGHIHVRSEAEVLRDLQVMTDAARCHNGHLLIRPHPSQQRGLYDDWMKAHNHPDVHFAGAIPLHPLLKATDVVASYGSTVTIEALIMERRVIQVKYYKRIADMPIGELGLAWLAQNHDDVARCVGEAFHDDVQAARMQERVKNIIPQQKAAPLVAELIRNIVGNKV